MGEGNPEPGGLAPATDENMRPDLYSLPFKSVKGGDA
jgi:hypothetical protein